jgi:hypothetical protein
MGLMSTITLKDTHQHNDTLHCGLNCGTQHKRASA